MDNKRNNRRKNERKELICAATAVVVLYTAMESIGITCPIKFITGISCAGCGMSRAWMAFLHLDIAKAFAYHPLFWLVPIACLLYTSKYFRAFDNTPSGNVFSACFSLKKGLFILIML